MKVLTPILIDDELRRLIIEFAFNSPKEYWYDNTVGGTYNRRFCKLDDHSLLITQKVKNYSKLVYSYFGVEDQEEESLFGNFIGVQGEGGHVHPHTDPKNNKGWDHVRINFLIQKPIQGGMPVIEGKEFAIDENRSWFNDASGWVHSSTPVIGDRRRVVLSLGAYVSPDKAKKMFEMLQ